jgi:integration host factor subunit beta
MFGFIGLASVPELREPCSGDAPSVLLVSNLGRRLAMLKSALIQRISSRNPHLYQRDVEKVLKAILDQIAGALARGDRVELRDFGVFSTRLRKARTGRNPRTGVAVSVAQKAIPSFKAAKEIRKRLNPQAAQGD